MDSPATSVILARRALLEYDEGLHTRSYVEDPMHGLQGPVALEISVETGFLTEITALPDESLDVLARKYRSKGT